MTPPTHIDHLDRDTLAAIVATTVAHYNDSADSFWLGTHDHDVSQNREALLRHIDAVPPFRLLDLGCGPGRDLVAFRDAGHEVTGVDAAANFCAMARRHAGCTVLQQDLLALALPTEHFDGVFANAVLFHVPTQEIPRVLADLHRTLKRRGVLFASNPRGDNREGWNGDRYGAYHDHRRWTDLLTAAGFEELEHYYRPAGKPRDQQPWLATVHRRL
jgi:SAM-dependent methyltransferase